METRLGSITAERALSIATAAFAASLPWMPDAAPFFLALIALAACWPGQGRRGLHRPGIGSPLGWMLALYALHLLGLLWTTNTGFAGLDLGIKAPLALFPLVFLFGRRVQPVDAWNAQRWFIRSNALTVVICCLWALGRFVALWSTPVPPAGRSAFELSLPFFSSEFALFLHPTYMGMYLTFALFLLARPGVGGAWSMRRALPLAMLLLLGVVLCASKAGWLLLVPTLIAIAVRHRKDRHVRRYAAWGLGLSLTLGIVLYATTDLVHERVDQVVTALRDDGHGDLPDNSTDERLQVWRAATALIASHPWLGSGTGDVKDELVRTYGERGYQGPLQKRLNAHDQYLNTGVALGAVGMLILLAMIVLPLLSAVRRRDVWLAGFILLNALNWTVESMLEVQAGVLFFAFFAWLLSPVEAEEGQH